MNRPPAGDAQQGRTDATVAASGVTRSETAPAPVGAYVHARRVGGLLFLAGIGPRTRSGGVREIPGVVFDAQGRVASYDIEVQTRAVFDNVRTVLRDSGSDWSRIVDVSVFLTDMARDFGAFNRVWGEAFAGMSVTRTTVEVRALPTPINVELKVIAEVG
jgi:2-aminomuconate deaminase